MHQALDCFIGLSVNCRRTPAAGFTARTWAATSQSKTACAGGQPLLDGRRRKPASVALDPGSDLHRFFVKQTEAGLVAPVEVFACGAVIGFARVRVAGVGGEELDEAAARMGTARGDHRWHGGGRCGQKYDRRGVEVRFHFSLIPGI